jgi:predicted acetyltransferase
VPALVPASLELGPPALRYYGSFLVADAESTAEGTGRGVTDEVGFAALLTRCERYAAGDVPEGRVRETTLWLVDGDVYLGRISIRHGLNDDLRRIGGHIGYDVRPSRRRQGLGTRMLALAIPHAAALGVDPALVTCDHDNVPSRRMIERFGGVPADDGVVVEGTLRFFLPTSTR